MYLPEPNFNRWNTRVSPSCDWLLTCGAVVHGCRNVRTHDKAPLEMAPALQKCAKLCMYIYIVNWSSCLCKVCVRTYIRMYVRTFIWEEGLRQWAQTHLSNHFTKVQNTSIRGSTSATISKCSVEIHGLKLGAPCWSDITPVIHCTSHCMYVCTWHRIQHTQRPVCRQPSYCRANWITGVYIP